MNAFPSPPPPIPPTPLASCDRALERLHGNRQRWVAQGFPERIALLRSAIAGMSAVAEEWVDASCRAKGHLPGSAGEGEEWLGGIMPVMRNLRLLVEAMEAGGQPALPGTTQRPDGQWVARVFPATLFDRALFTGFTAEVRVMPGQLPSQGRIYREKAAGRPGEGGVCLVLGAGNQASIGPMDVLYKLFVDDEVVVLKLNPVNEYLGPLIERAFKGFVDAGFLEVVFGGAEVGAHLCQHPLVHSIHITGSDKTHDAIVWGPDPGQAERKANGERANLRPITSELGAVTPIIVVPGPWSEADLDFQARHVVGMVVHNASFNCNAGKVLLVAKGWSLRDRFLERVHAHLSRQPLRKAYYPGAGARYQRFLEHYSDARAYGDASDEVVPWTLLPSVPAEAGEYALVNEAFCGVLAVVDVDASEPVPFLDRVVPFCNQHVWGTLSAAMIVHPRVEREHPEAVERALDHLEYGGIGVNVWPAMVYALVSPTWGAYPGHPLEDIGSGRGVVHNTYLIDHPQKSIVRAPFRIMPVPGWFPDHRNLPALGRRISDFEAAPSWFKLPALTMAALRG